MKIPARQRNGKNEFVHATCFPPLPHGVPNQRTAQQGRVSSPTLFCSCCSCSWMKERCPSSAAAHGELYLHTERQVKKGRKRERECVRVRESKEREREGGREGERERKRQMGKKENKWDVKAFQ